MEVKVEVEELPAAAEMVGEVTEITTEVLKKEESVVEEQEAENTDKIEEEEKERGEEGEDEEQGGAKKPKGLWESEVRTCVEVDCWEVGEGQQPQVL